VFPKINSALVDGKFNSKLKLSAENHRILTSRLLQVADYCPKEFSRKPQIIKKYGGFKATENRQLFLYVAPTVYYGLVNAAVYKHLLLLHSAIRILSSSPLSDNLLDFARLALNIFVTRAEGIYGPEFLSYVTHCLLHLVDDVRRFGPLDEISMFPYENNMTYFRKACRKPHQHLQQIAKRREEKLKVGSKNKSCTRKAMRPSQPWVSPVVFSISSGSRQFQVLDMEKFRISVKDRDNTILFRGSRVGLVQSILLSNNRYQLVVKEFSRIDNFFKIGIPSSSIGVFRCSVLFNDVTIIELSEMEGKCFRMPYWHTEGHQDPIPNVWIVTALLHTI